MSRIRRDLIALAASLVVFAGCALIAADGRVGPIERAAFQAVNGLPEGLYQPMLAFQYLGVLGMPLIVAVGALAAGRGAGAGGAVEVGSGAGGQAAGPAAAAGDHGRRGDPAGGAPGGLSFVSGHAIITFAIAGLLGMVLPRRWAVVGFVLAGLNAVARVYLGAHNPLDVVGGAAVGLAIAAALDLVLDVARDRRVGWRGQAASAGEERAI